MVNGRIHNQLYTWMSMKVIIIIIIIIITKILNTCYIASYVICKEIALTRFTNIICKIFYIADRGLCYFELAITLKPSRLEAESTDQERFTDRVSVV